MSPTIDDLVKAKVSEEQSNALLVVLESQRQSDLNAFPYGYVDDLVGLRRRSSGHGHHHRSLEVSRRRSP